MDSVADDDGEVLDWVRNQGWLLGGKEYRAEEEGVEADAVKLPEVEEEDAEDVSRDLEVRGVELREEEASELGGGEEESGGSAKAEPEEA